MPEYIEREALQKRLEMHQATNPSTIGKKQFQEGYYLGLSEAEIMIAQAPKADVAEVRHGHWINASIKGVSHYRCTECGEYIEAVWTANFDYRYCPNCGARMDGGADNGEREAAD